MTGLIIAFAYSWQLTLVLLGTAPLLIVSGKGMMKRMMVFREKDVSYTSAGGVCSEAVANIRTVAALGFEDRLTRIFDESLGSGLKTATRYALGSST